MSDGPTRHVCGCGYVRGSEACSAEHGDPLVLPVSALPEPPAPPEDCCCNAEWRGRLCAYHQGFEDGWEALREALEK